MSIIKAYGCDCCGNLQPQEKIVGISMQPDMFDNLKSFPINMRHPEKEFVHLCTDCYRERVEIPAENASPRGKDAGKYAHTVKEFHYLVKLLCVNNYNSKKYFK